MKTQPLYAFVHKETGFILRVDFDSIPSVVLFFSEQPYETPWVNTNKATLDFIQQKNLNLPRYGDVELPGNFHKIDLNNYEIVQIGGEF